MLRFPKVFRKHLASEDGSTSFEAIIILPVFLFLFVSIFELGMATTRLTVLERGLDVTMRDLRLSTNQVIENDVIRDRVCSVASILKDCEENLLVQLTLIKRNNVWTTPARNAACIDKSVADAVPVTQPSDGLANDVVLIRACYVVEPLVPAFGLGRMLEVDDANNMQLVAYSAFAKEPN